MNFAPKCALLICKIYCIIYKKQIKFAYFYGQNKSSLRYMFDQIGSKYLNLPLSLSKTSAL